VRLLIDTNIVLEVLLEQSAAAEARDLLAKVNEHEFYISDFSVHSIGVLLFRQAKHDVFSEFLNDTLVRAGMALATLPADRMVTVVDVARRFRLDFDDAYQYALARERGFTLVSFDRDFDRTEAGRRAPASL